MVVYIHPDCRDKSARFVHLKIFHTRYVLDADRSEDVELVQVDAAKTESII